MNIYELIKPFIEPAGLGFFSFIFGFLIIILDIFITIIRGISFLNIKYEKKFLNKIKSILCWSIGAGIVGFLGGLLNIFNSEGMTQSAIFIAICWPLVITSFVEKFQKQLGNQKN